MKSTSTKDTLLNVISQENKIFEDTLFALLKANAQVSDIKLEDFANGEGIRTSIWLPGYSFYCKGCFNKCSWDYESGRPFTEIDLLNITNRLIHILNDGVTLLGGEPLMVHNESQYKKYQERNCATTLAIAKLAKFYDKTVWVYSGATYEELSESGSNIVEEALRYIDVLVDGRFEEDKKDLGLKFRGSSNQRILHIKNGKIDYVEK